MKKHTYRSKNVNKINRLHAEHNEEHNTMLKKLNQMEYNINNDDWTQNEIQAFVEGWKSTLFKLTWLLI